jgi:hypothetical protein
MKEELNKDIEILKNRVTNRKERKKSNYPHLQMI